MHLLKSRKDNEEDDIVQRAVLVFLQCMRTQESELLFRFLAFSRNDFLKRSL